MIKEKKNEIGIAKSRAPNVGQANVSAITQEEIEKEIIANKAKIKELAKMILSGKCPIKVMEYNGEIEWKHPILKDSCNSLQDACKQLTATTDFDIAYEIIFNGTLALPTEESRAAKFNIVFQTLAESSPQDATEAKLCLQASALYSQGMRYLGRAERDNMISQADFYMKNTIKLLRLHNETVEALNKYRRGGEQRVVVQHMQVGGNAIVGSVFKGGGAKIKNERGNPMLKLCGAKARRNKHQPCRQPAMANGRCRLHGGLTPKHNPGPRTAAGKMRQKMSSWKHGLRSKEAKLERVIFREMMKSCKENLQGF